MQPNTRRALAAAAALAIATVTAGLASTEPLAPSPGPAPEASEPAQSRPAADPVSRAGLAAPSPALDAPPATEPRILESAGSAVRLVRNPLPSGGASVEVSHVHLECDNALQHPDQERDLGPIGRPPLPYRLGFGDRVLEIDGQTAADLDDDALASLLDLGPDETADFVVERGGALLRVRMQGCEDERLASGSFDDRDTYLNETVDLVEGAVGKASPATQQTLRWYGSQLLEQVGIDTTLLWTDEDEAALLALRDGAP